MDNAAEACVLDKLPTDNDSVSADSSLRSSPDVLSILRVFHRTELTCGEDACQLHKDGVVQKGSNLQLNVA